MHCAKLFEMVKTAKDANIFERLVKNQYNEVRKVCIEAILHTDMVHHFSMVKEVQMLYEVNSLMLDMSREMYMEDASEFPSKEALEVFQQGDTKKKSAKPHIAPRRFV